MLPDIAFIISAYAAFRIISELLRGPVRFPNRNLYIAAIVLGAIALVVIGVSCTDVYSIGSQPTTHETP